MSVPKINRGTECIHPAVVRAMFNIEQSLELETVENEMLNLIIDSIEKGSFDALLEANINPFGESAKELIQLYYLSHVILTKFSATEQFKSGITSIYPGFCKRTSYEAMRRFLETNNAKVTLDQFLRLVRYDQLKEQEKGSNLYKEFEDYVFEFELFLADVYSGTVQKDAENVTLEMILEFCNGMDRVPAFGFHNNIEVYFCDISLPTVSTCGLILNCPKKSMKEKMVCALSFRSGFGEI